METLFDDEPNTKSPENFPVVSFVVYGAPQQRGSKVAIVRKGRDGKPIEKNGRILTFNKDSNEAKSKAWMTQVAREAAGAFGPGRPLIDEPVMVAMRFYFNRPKSHYGTGNNAHRVKPSSPKHHCQSPDIDKLARCLCDSLTGAVIFDDKLICKLNCERHWTDTQERAEVEVWLL